ncbi:hypothetical protein Tco_0087952 [Tanacetum coccineum]
MILRDVDESFPNHQVTIPYNFLTSHTDLTSPEVNDDIFDPEGDIIENLLNLDKTKDLPPYHDNPLRIDFTFTLKRSWTSRRIRYLLTIDLIEEMDSISGEDSVDKIRLMMILMDDHFDSREEIFKDSKIRDLLKT